MHSPASSKACMDAKRDVEPSDFSNFLIESNGKVSPIMHSLQWVAIEDAGRITLQQYC